MAAHDHRVSSAQELVCSHAVSEDGPASTDFLTGLTRTAKMAAAPFFTESRATAGLSPNCLRNAWSGCSPARVRT